MAGVEAEEAVAEAEAEAEVEEEAEAEAGAVAEAGVTLEVAAALGQAAEARAVRARHQVEPSSPYLRRHLQAAVNHQSRQ